MDKLRLFLVVIATVLTACANDGSSSQTRVRLEPANPPPPPYQTATDQWPSTTAPTPEAQSRQDTSEQQTEPQQQAQPQPKSPGPIQQQPELILPPRDQSTVQIPLEEPPPLQLQTQPAQPAVSADIAEVLRLVNDVRRKSGLNPLTLDSRISAVAKAHAEDMDRRGFFDHVNPDGKEPMDRLNAAGIDPMMSAENIAAGQSTPASVMNDWMVSPSHAEAILKPAYKKIGIGRHRNFWVQLFTN